MEVPIDQFKTLADVFGGILETYLEAYLEEHPDAKCVRIEPEDKQLTALVDCLLEKKCTADMEIVMRYSSSKALHPDTKFNIYDLERACQLGHLKYARWLELKPTQLAVDLAIQGDRVDVVQWCVSITPDLKIDTDLLYQYDAVEITIRFDKISDMKFTEACKRGSLRIAQHIVVERPDIDVHADDEDAFRLACYSGHLDVATWLVNMYPETNVHANDEGAFRWACYGGRLEVARWLVDKYPDIDVHINGEDAFLWACYNGHINVAQWLVDKYPETNVHARNEEAFRDACSNIEVAKWLLTVMKNVRYNKLEALFDIVIGSNNRELLLYMYEMFPVFARHVGRVKKIIG